MELLLKNFKLLGYLSILVSIVAWATEILGFVAACPYCQVQRSAIGILGFIMVLICSENWFLKYISYLIASFAFIVGANQHFFGWKEISNGSFTFETLIYFLLSACAMAILLGQGLLIHNFKK